ncbi:hypothetical protein EV197_2917 [Aquimarina brevivitae]|uniref:Uncharacterized protein n=1 Tax=Aquimarina brevivitae TaxID=323412 RepID=A0A4Q7NXY3_9FLAO|nr:hypothetical protein EV197_2917 [Aquimarina brevivitae]
MHSKYDILFVLSRLLLNSQKIPIENEDISMY